AEIETRRGSWSEETPFSRRRSAKVLTDFLSAKMPPQRNKQLFTVPSRFVRILKDKNSSYPGQPNRSTHSSPLPACWFRPAIYNPRHPFFLLKQPLTFGPDKTKFALYTRYPD
ncbi:MAG: hypothetical protein KGY56_00005, partial [Desulfobacterales bacterium]|nr:hypothetical protein [Desulfobacterales bacterium]